MKVLGYVISVLLGISGITAGLPSIIDSITDNDIGMTVFSIALTMLYLCISAYIVYMVRRVGKLEKQLSKNS